jgi:hypothetical protein
MTSKINDLETIKNNKEIQIQNQVITPYMQNSMQNNHLGGGPVVRAWDQEVCSLCDLRFESCGCSYDSHWKLT